MCTRLGSKLDFSISYRFDCRLYNSSAMVMTKDFKENGRKWLKIFHFLLHLFWERMIHLLQEYFSHIVDYNGVVYYDGH
jgi:hypothetical protein